MILAEIPKVLSSSCQTQENYNYKVWKPKKSSLESFSPEVVVGVKQSFPIFGHYHVNNLLIKILKKVWRKL